MSLPSVWLLLSTVNQNLAGATTLQLLETGLVIVITILCLPYIGYVIITVSQAEVLTIRPRNLVFILMAIAGAAIVYLGSQTFSSFGAALWWAFMHLLDPGTVASDNQPETAQAALGRRFWQAVR